MNSESTDLNPFPAELTSQRLFVQFSTNSAAQKRRESGMRRWMHQMVDPHNMECLTQCGNWIALKSDYTVGIDPRNLLGMSFLFSAAQPPYCVCPCSAILGEPVVSITGHLRNFLRQRFDLSSCFFAPWFTRYLTCAIRKNTTLKSLRTADQNKTSTDRQIQLFQKRRRPTPLLKREHAKTKYQWMRYGKGVWRIHPAKRHFQNSQTEGIEVWEHSHVPCPPWCSKHTHTHTHTVSRASSTHRCLCRSKCIVFSQNHSQILSYQNSIACLLAGKI